MLYSCSVIFEKSNTSYFKNAHLFNKTKKNKNATEMLCCTAVVSSLLGAELRHGFFFFFLSELFN